MDKIEKVKAEIERLYNQSLADENRQAELGLKSAACTSYGKSKVCKELLSFIESMQKEPASDDLEQAIDNYLATYWGGDKEKQDWPFLKKMAIHFANWQKKKNDYAIEIAHMAGEEEGKNIMKQQMMAKAVDVTIAIPYQNGYGGYTQLVDSKEGLPFGEKLKVLVIKKEIEL